MKASKVRANYVVRVAIQGIEEEIAMLANVMGSDWLTDERLGLIYQAYLAKVMGLDRLTVERLGLIHQAYLAKVMGSY